MKTNAFLDSFKIIMDQSTAVTRERQGRIIRYTGKLKLTDDDKIKLVANLVKHLGCSPEKAVEKLRSSFQQAFDRKRSRKGLISLLPLLIFAFPVFLSELARLGRIALFACPIAFFLYLFTARKRAMKKIWKNQRYEGVPLQQIIDEMMDAHSRSWFALINKPLVIGSAVCILLVEIVAALPYLPKPFHETIAQQFMTSLGPGEYARLLADAKKLEGQKAENALAQAAAKLASTEDDYLLVAGLANDLADAGIISRECAAEYINDSLTHITAPQINTDLEISLLINMLGHVSPDVVDSLTDRFDRIAAQNRTLSYALGAYYAQHRSTRELVELAQKLRTAEFLQGALEKDDMARFLVRMDELSSHAHRLLLVQTVSGRFTLPDDVLAFLREMKAFGITPTECYPEGAKLDWDMSRIDFATMCEDWIDCGKWLPLKVTEAKEKMEYREVPREQHNRSDEFESVYEPTYEANNALGKDAFEVVLDTEWLEHIPEERLPETVAEADSLLVTSTLYMRRGTLRNTFYHSSDTSSQESPLPTFPSKPLLTDPLEDVPAATQEPPTDFIIWQHDYPTYYACQSIAIIDLKSDMVNYWFCGNVVDTPELPDDQAHTSDRVPRSFNDHDIERLYIATPDEAWAHQAREEVRTLLDDTEWNLDMAAFLDAMSESEE